MKLILLSFLLSFSLILNAQTIRRGEGADVPVGTTLSVAGPNCPSGFLSANGSAVSRTTYSKLFTQIGTTYGVGNGSTTFNLPKHNWHIDANIGGANPSLGTSALTSYTEVADGGLDLVINTSKDSALAEIPCSSGTSSTGYTCSGVFEHVGIAFIPHGTGIYEACFTVAPVVGGTGGVTTVWQVIETPNSSTSILQEGGDRVNKTYIIGAQDTSPSSSVCGTFSFSDTSKKTLRLMREQVTVGSPSFHNLYADRYNSLGQRDIHVTVRPLTRLGNCIKF